MRFYPDGDSQRHKCAPLIGLRAGPRTWAVTSGVHSRCIQICHISVPVGIRYRTTGPHYFCENRHRVRGSRCNSHHKCRAGVLKHRQQCQFNKVVFAMRLQLYSSKSSNPCPCDWRHQTKLRTRDHSDESPMWCCLTGEPLGSVRPDYSA